MSLSESNYRSQIMRLVVKANLRHRIEKLGAEKSEEELSELQRQLKEVAREQIWNSSSRRDELPERPRWANGCFVYVTPWHVTQIEEFIRNSRVVLELQTKHVLVSEEYKEPVIATLSACPEGPGREAFLMRRAGAIEQEDIFSMISRTVFHQPVLSGER